MDTKDFPQEFLRGLASKDFVCDGHVMASAFQFDEVGRADNMLEASINWLDDEGAIDIALNQRKKENGKIQFSAGVARLDLEQVKLFLYSFAPGTLSYERASLPENNYHGNLLLPNTMKKAVKLQLMNALALAAGTNIIPQTND